MRMPYSRRFIIRRLAVDPPVRRFWREGFAVRLSVILCLCFTFMTVPVLAQDAGEHWAFKPVRSVSVPVPSRDETRSSTKPSGRDCGPIDCFVLAKLQEHGLQPNAPADKPTLLRRATFDL